MWPDCLGCECGPRGFCIRLARLAAVLGCRITGGRGGGNCGRPGGLGEVAGSLRALSPQRAPAFQHFLRGLQRWVLLLERGGRPGEWRAVTHGIGSGSALVFQIDSEGAEIALETQGAMGFPAAQGDIPPIARLYFASVAFVGTVRSRPVPFSYGGPQMMSLSPLERSGFGPAVPLNDSFAGVPSVSPVAGLADQ